MDVLSLNNCGLRLLSCLGLLVTSIFGSYVLAPYHNVDAQEATPADQPSSTSASSNNESSTGGEMEYDTLFKTSYITGTFDMSQLDGNVDFKIDFPEGWIGLKRPHGYLPPAATVSPEGGEVMQDFNKSNPTTVIMTVDTDFSQWEQMAKLIQSGELPIPPHDVMVTMMAEEKGCKILDYSFVKINNANSLQYLEQCGTGQDEIKTKNYLFAAGDYTITVSLVGKTASFDENLPKFERSVQSIKINQPKDLQQLIPTSATT